MLTCKSMGVRATVRTADIPITPTLGVNLGFLLATSASTETDVRLAARHLKSDAVLLA